MIVVLLVAARVLDDVNTAFDTNPQFSVDAKDNVSNLNTRFPTIVDSIIILTFVLLTISLVVSAFMIDTHPIFFALSLPSFLVIMMVNAILANAIDDVGNTTALSGIYASLPMTQFIASHWVAMMTITAFISFMVFFSKK